MPVWASSRNGRTVLGREAGFVTAIDLSQGSRWVGLVEGGIGNCSAPCLCGSGEEGRWAVPVFQRRPSKGVHWSQRTPRLTRHVECGQPNEAIPTQLSCLFESDLVWGCDATVTRSSPDALPKSAQPVFCDWFSCTASSLRIRDSIRDSTPQPAMGLPMCATTAERSISNLRNSPS